MKLEYLGLAYFTVVLSLGTAALADDGAATPGPGPSASDAAAAPGQAAADPWGPVSANRPSLADLAPALLPYLNNGPLFGVPGTVVGDLRRRTQLSGDWGGLRTDLAHRGLFVDVYSTGVYQNVTSGGLKTGGSFVENTQISINLDTARAGLWAGGLLHITLQSRYGASPQRTFTAGTTVPQYTGLAFPDPVRTREFLPTEYFLVQALSPKFSVILGKIDVLTMPDQTLFGNSYKYYFTNFNFNKNPMSLNFYNPTALTAAGAWTPTHWLTVAGGVLDPNSKAENFASHAFDGVNLYLTAIFSYSVQGLPGQFAPQFNWSNKPKLDRVTPFGPLSPGSVPQAVAVLAGSPVTDGLPVRLRPNSWVAIANVSQYLLIEDSPEEMAQKLKAGQPLRGLGVFGRVGYAPKESNTISRDASVALFAHGLLAARRDDSLGLGFFYNGVSAPLKDNIAKLSGAKVQDEKGLEVFYAFALTPAISITPSYQHIWNPLTAQAVGNQRAVDLVLARVTVNW